MRLKSSMAMAVVFVGLAWWGGYLYTEYLPERFSPQKHFPLAMTNGENDYLDSKGVFHGRQVESEAVRTSGVGNVLGSQDEDVEKKIEVDLTNQKLYAVENGKKVAEFSVSTGKWGRTPTGTFRIWIKFVKTKMSGGSKALRTYYYLPNVPYTMFFSNSEVAASRGYGIHGTYWHSNFGETMSHGCVNMRTRDVEKLFAWAGPDNGGRSVILASEDNPGTEIVIYGTAP